MIIEQVEFTNFKKHTNATFQFGPGSNVIVGANYQGKTSIMQGILVGLFGNTAVAGPAEEMVTTGQKDFKVKLTLSNGITIERSLKNSSVSRAGEQPYARGHSAVNKAVLELLATSKDTFMKVFASEQGSPQKLLDMEGAELQRFIETIIGIDKLDLVLKESNRRMSSLKDKSEGVAVWLLSEEQAAEAADQKAKYQLALKLSEQQLAEILSEKNILTSSIEEVRNELNCLHAREKLEAQLSGKEILPVPDVANLAGQLNQLGEELEAAKAARDQQLRINQLHSKYSEKKAALDERLVEAGDEDLEPLIENLQQQLTSLQERLVEIERFEIKAATLNKERTALELNLSSLGETSEIKPEQTVEAIADSIAVARNDLLTLQKLDKQSKCPTCKKPLGEHNPEDIAADIAVAEQVLESLEYDYESLKAEWAKYKNWLAQEEMGSRLEQVIAELNTIQITVPSLQVKEQLEGVRTELSTAKAAKQNRDSVIAALERLEKPEGEVAEPVDVEPLSEKYFSLKSEYQQAVAYKQKAEANNKLVEELQEQFNNLPSVTLNSVTDGNIKLADLESKLNQLSNAEIAEINFKHETNFKLQAVVATLDKHKEAWSICQGIFKEIEDFRFISQLLTNSRTGYIQRAMHTIFSVTTEFCKLSTGGDIEEVGFEDGIKYKEGGTWRTKRAASGAQKSLIGLGMKMGIANLVVTPFSSMLLDEATAAMSDEISLQASLAMASLCEQSISVSHRKLDVAGNVIQL